MLAPVLRELLAIELPAPKLGSDSRDQRFVGALHRIHILPEEVQIPKAPHEAARLVVEGERARPHLRRRDEEGST